MRGVLRTRTLFLTDRQTKRLDAVFQTNEHAEVEATWSIYQRVIIAYQEPKKQLGKAAFQAVVHSITTTLPDGLPELRTLGTTFRRSASDILAYFDHPRTSNGPSEATNGRLEHLRGIALGFRNITHYIARSLIEAGGFRPQLHSQLLRARFAVPSWFSCGQGGRACDHPGGSRGAV